MGVKWTTATDKITNIEASLRSMKGRKVKVGALQGSHAWL